MDVEPASPSPSPAVPDRAPVSAAPTQPSRASILGRWLAYLVGVGSLTVGVVLAAILLGAPAVWTGLAALAILLAGGLRALWRRGKGTSAS